MKSIYKRLTKRTLLSILIVHLSLLSFAKNYYVSNSGNDTNSGLTEILAWRTLAKVNATSFSSGDNILLKCGDIFPVNESNYITQAGLSFGSYGTGVKPEISGYGDIIGWTTSGNWSLYATGIYRMNYDYSFHRIWLNETEVKECATLTLTANEPWRVTGGYLYVYATSNPATYFTSMKVGAPAGTTSTLTLSNITGFSISGIKISGGINCMVLTNCKNITIDNCEIGYRTSQFGIYIKATTGNTSDNIIIKNSKFDTDDRIYYTYYRGFAATTDAIWLGSGSINCKIFNNVFLDWSHSAVNITALDSSYPFHDNEIYSNYITAPDIDYSRGFGIYYPSNGYNVSIHDNVIVHTTIQNQLEGNGLKFYNNLIDDVSEQVYTAKRGEQNGISIEGTVTAPTNMEIFGNTITNCDYTGIRIYGTSGDIIEKSGNSIHDNNIFNNGNGAAIHYGYQMIVFTSPMIHNNTFQANHFYNTTGGNLISYKSTGYTISGFNAVTTNNGDLISGNDAILTYNIPNIGKYVTNISDMRIEHNATSLANTIALSQPMIDLKGTQYSGTVTLQPYSSVILMKGLTPVVSGAPTSPVATAGNANASVTFLAPTNNGGSAITGYTVTSIPAGGIDSNAGSTSLTHTITGLTNGTSYTFTVKATNSAGTSVASVASNAVIPKAPVATNFLFTGPSSGNVNSISNNFTVTPNNPYTGTITITPSGTGSTGLSTIVLTFSNSVTAQTFTIIPTVVGNITLTPSNNSTLINPAGLTYAVNAMVPNAPTSIVATAGNAGATITFVTPVSNGGSAITGYTVTSVPAGGIDANAGSTSLTHTITGLTNGTSYTFTVKATNSVGTSVASVASNSVIPQAPTATAFTFTGPSSGNVNSVSSNFTVTPNNLYTGTITITPSGTGSAGLSAKVLKFSNSSSAQNFTIDPTVPGNITLTATNNGTLTNPVNLIFTANAILPDAPTSVVATSGDASASVTFVTPTNIGGSVITGYTVTSIPSGGIDANAGSTALTHTITGLANGTSYAFTVNATNSVGSSVASVASNSVIPVVASVIIKQGEIVPSHFTTVWQGLNGLNHMNINVVSAMLEDIPLSVDDEIAVFSGSACVGTSKLTKSIVPTDNSTFLTILASQNDGSGNGFIDNDTIVFKIWNNQTKNELQVNAAVYRNDVSTWKTNGRYSPASTAVAEIASYQVYTQSIELLKGYNMISTYVSAQNPNISVVTKTLVDQANLIKMQDETGNSLENWGTFGGWINQLGSMEETEGYKIQVANNCTLQVTGRSIAMPFDISLKTGWNIISYPRTDMINAMNVFQALIDQNKLVKVQDEAGNSIENWGLFGGWKNGIGNFIPGKAYKVKMSADAILTFQESYPKAALVIAKAEQTEYYHSSVEGNGTDHMNIYITGLNNVGLSVGDELAAFDGAVCVATAKVTEANLLSGSASLASSFSTDTQNQNGFKVGDPIQISVWNKLSGDESKVNAEVLTGQLKYEKNASVLVKMKSATLATGITNLDDIVKIDVFPNPCQGRVTVRFSEIPEANSRIEISDISGRKLISRVISGTSEEFNLDSFTSGLYLVRSILGSSEFVQKLIVNK